MKNIDCLLWLKYKLLGVLKWTLTTGTPPSESELGSLQSFRTLPVKINSLASKDNFLYCAHEVFVKQNSFHFFQKNCLIFCCTLVHNSSFICCVIFLECPFHSVELHV
jgi:hypothetical protein